MDRKEILFFLEAVANEKGLPYADVLDAVQQALASAFRKLQKEEMGVRVSIDQDTGEYQAFHVWRVVDPEKMNEIEEEGEQVLEEFNPLLMMDIKEARERKPDVQLDEIVEEPLPSADFGRISAQTAKQVILQKLGELGRRKVVEQFENRIGEIIHTTVTRVYRGQVFLDLGEDVEGFLPREQQIPTESYSPGKRLRAYLYEVGMGNRGPQIFLSRAIPAFLEELFKMEVPEISDGIIEIRAVVRDPGERAKIAVYTGDPNLDPIGTCVGIRGTRVHAVMNELGGERIDIVVWDNNPAEFVVNALSPAEIASISVDENKRCMDISVESDQLPQAIGRSGQNVRLASQLTGWELNVMSTEDMKEKRNIKRGDLIQLFVDTLKIKEELAEQLFAAKIEGIEEIAYMPDKELLAIEGMDEELVKKVKEIANDAVLLSL